MTREEENRLVVIYSNELRSQMFQVWLFIELVANILVQFPQLFAHR